MTHLHPQLGLPWVCFYIFCKFTTVFQKRFFFIFLVVYLTSGHPCTLPSLTCDLALPSHPRPPPSHLSLHPFLSPLNPCHKLKFIQMIEIKSFLGKSCRAVSKVSHHEHAEVSPSCQITHIYT